ncbi:uncharacterized protein [Bos mutus]|uniref:uncharacterized protein n=1 Tax=Bos mutus TaxID=72004 RepID=UPI0038B69591
MFMGHFGAAATAAEAEEEEEETTTLRQAAPAALPPASSATDPSAAERSPQPFAAPGSAGPRPAPPPPTDTEAKKRECLRPPAPARPPAAPAPPATRRGETPSPRLPGPKDLGRPMKRRFELALKNEQGYSRSKRCRKHVPGRSICMRGWWNRTGETRSVSLPLSWKPRGPSVDMRNHKIMAA